MIPYGRQSIDKYDIEAVEKILKSDWLTQGPTVENFEAEVCRYTGAPFGVAVNSATSALHVACIALGLGQGDILWTSPNTFVASANCALYCGAEVDFVDICPDTFNMSYEALRTKLIHAKKIGKLPKIVIPVHFGGQSCEMEEFKKLAKEYKFKIIEDASHALGAEYKGKSVGECEHSDITVLSFHPVKMITTGEGGMALTRSKSLYEKMLIARSHGIARDPETFSQVNDGEIWGYQQLDLGFNYRMSDIHAALGISQLKKLNHFISRRTEIANRYNDAFMRSSIVPQLSSKNATSSYHLYAIRLKLSESKITQKEVFNALRNKGIGVNLHYIPVYRHPYFRDLGFPKGYCDEAEGYFREALSLPIFPSLTQDEQEQIIDTISDILS